MGRPSLGAVSTIDPRPAVPYNVSHQSPPIGAKEGVEGPFVSWI